MSRRQLFTVPLKMGAEINQVKPSGSRFKRMQVFMSCVIRCGPHCRRMVVKVTNTKALREIGEIQRTVSEAGQHRLWKQPLSWGALEAGAVHQTLWIHRFCFKICGKLPLILATFPGNASTWEC